MMRKHLLLQLFLCFLGSTLTAQPASMMMDPAMMGGMPQMDIFAHITGTDPDDVIIDAFATKRKMLAAISSLEASDKDLERRLIAHAKVIDRMRKDTSHIEGQDGLKMHAIALRRYEKLSQACVRETFDVKEVRNQLNLIDRHNALVMELFDISLNQHAAQMVLQKSENPYQHVESFQSYLKGMEPRIEEIQREMKTLERKLLKDERTWKQKYGPLILWSVVSLGVLISGGVIMHKASRWLDSLLGNNAHQERVDQRRAVRY